MRIQHLAQAPQLTLAAIATGVALVMARPMPMETGEPSSSSNRWWLDVLDKALGETAPLTISESASHHLADNFLGPAISPAKHDTLSSLQSLTWAKVGHMTAQPSKAVFQSSSAGSTHVDNPIISGTDATFHSEPWPQPESLDYTSFADDTRTYLLLSGDHWFQTHGGYNNLPQSQAVPRQRDEIAYPAATSRSPYQAVTVLNQQHLLFPGLLADANRNHVNLWDHTEAIGSWDYPDEPLTKKKKTRNSIPASKFLKHHDHFKEIAISDRSNTMPVAAAEISPKAGGLKALVNSHVFGDKLIWKTQNEHMFDGTHLRQFVSRINARKTSFQTKAKIPSRELGFQGQIVVAPHRFFPSGNSMFDPDPGAKQLLFSVWAPSQDAETTRLQFVGSASLTAQKASEVLKWAQLQSGKDSSPMVDHVLLPVAPPRDKSEYFPARAATGLYASTRRWLREFTLVEQAGEDNEQSRGWSSATLKPRLHKDADALKQLANAVIFSGNVVWQIKPEQVMLSTGSDRLVDVFRHHRRSSEMFITKPEITAVLPYQLLILPYETHDSRARLFDVSLKGHTHTFTLWAARSRPGGGEADKLDLVSGGSLDVTRTADVLDKARSLLVQVSEAAARRST